jgi:hypothetical protein
MTKLPAAVKPGRSLPATGQTKLMATYQEPEPQPKRFDCQKNILGQSALALLAAEKLRP